MCLLELFFAHKCYPCHDNTMDDIYNEYDTLSLQKPNVSFGRFMDFNSHDFDFFFIYVLYHNCFLFRNFTDLCTMFLSTTS
jgi:hypothetical protein